MQARWWHIETTDKGEAARCELCSHNCRIESGRFGYCRARRYGEEGFSSPYLGRFTSIAVDPIEKKPLRHWQPGTSILSLGSLGCTMRCPFCQNFSIAQPTETPKTLTALDPSALLFNVRKMNLTSVAYTYNEPTLQAEYILAAAPVLREAGVATVLVTNGSFAAEPLEELIPWLDALNVDVKTFNPGNYARMGGSLDTVRRNVTRLVQAGIHVELTCLVVPGISDNPEEFAAMVDWIATLSPDLPLHISRYFPRHKYTAPMTDIDLLRRFAGIARERLRRVHAMNV